MITSFDKNTLKLIREEMNAALKAVTEKHGVAFDIGKITYSIDGESFSARVNAVCLKAVGSEKEQDSVSNAPYGAAHKWTKAYIQNHDLVGMKLEDLGKTITIQGRTFRIAGYTSNSKRGNIILSLPNMSYIVVPAEIAKSKLS